MTLPLGILQWGVTPSVETVASAATSEQKADDAVMALGGSQVKGCATVVISMVGVHPPGDVAPKTGEIPLAGRPDETHQIGGDGIAPLELTPFERLIRRAGTGTATGTVFAQQIGDLPVTGIRASSRGDDPQRSWTEGSAPLARRNATVSR